MVKWMSERLATPEFSVHFCQTLFKQLMTKQMCLDDGGAGESGWSLVGRKFSGRQGSLVV